MLRRFALILAALLLPAAAAAAQATTNVVIETELGNIVVELETERAPVSAARSAIGLSYAGSCRRTRITLTGSASIWPFMKPSPLSGSVGAAKIARTTSIPSTTRPNAA